MKLQVKPNRWSCLATSFAMAMEVPVESLFIAMQHDGSAIINPALPGILKRQGHHVQECIHAAWRYGSTVTPHELMPVSQYANGQEREVYFGQGNADRNWIFFNGLVANYQGVITGRGRHTDHAVAFDRGTIYDPDGEVFPYSQDACASRYFFPRCLWIVRSF